MLLPRIERESREVGSRLRAVILTVLRCVFICISTPAGRVSNACNSLHLVRDAPVIVPWITEPFLSSTVTVSLLSFIRNLRERKRCLNEHTSMVNR